jgi:hypothetical protein
VNPDARSNQKVLPQRALGLPPVPLDAPIFQRLSSALIRWEMLEADVRTRNQFSGFALIESPQVTAHAYFLDSRFVGIVASIGADLPQLLTKEAFMPMYTHREAIISLFNLDRYAVQVLLETPSWRLEYERTVPQASVTAVMAAMSAQQYTGQMLVGGVDWHGVITLNNGQAVLSSFQQNDKLIFQQEALTRIALEAGENGTRFGVFGARAFSTVDEGTVLTDNSFDEVVRTWNEILGFCEARTDAVRGRETFDNAFRQARLALVEKHAVLDPFLDELRFTASVLSVRQPSLEVFEALVPTYLETLRTLGIQPNALYALLKPIRDKHLKIWRAAGLEVVCPLSQ